MSFIFILNCDLQTYRLDISTVHDVLLLLLLILVGMLVVLILRVVWVLFVCRVSSSWAMVVGKEDFHDKMHWYHILWLEYHSLSLISCWSL